MTLPLAWPAAPIRFSGCDRRNSYQHASLRYLSRALENVPSAPVLFPERPARRLARLMSETELVDELPVLREIGALQVLQEAAAAADHAQQAALPVVVLRVDPEVLGEAVDALGEQRHLDPARTGVPVVQPVFPDRRRLVVHRPCSLIVGSAVG